MDYSAYSAYDFALDESFQQWVFKDDPKAMAFWERWLHLHPDKKEEIAEARELVLLLKHDPDEPTAEEFHRVWHHIQAAQKRPDSTRPEQPLPLRPTRFHRQGFRMAAVFMGLLLVTAIVVWVYQNNTSYSYVTRFGETKTITLPDQSTVKLNANSSLTYRSHWLRQGPREIWLEGEGFFSVVRQPNDQKFIVYANQVAVEVLGTQFNVSDRHGKTQVVLNAGKVKLNLEDTYTSQTTALVEKDLYMQPGEMVEILHKEKSYVQKQVDAEVYTAWKDNKFIFRDLPLQNIAQIIEDTYGLKVIIKDTAVAGRKFTATYPTDDVSILLKALATSFDLHIEQTKEQITLEARDASGETPGQP